MSPEKLSVAVLGTGIMGSAMARNLCRAGLDVRVWNRTRARAEPLAADGARVAGTPAEAADGASVVLTMVHDGAAALESMRAATPALRPGAVWLQTTTAGPEEAGTFVALAEEHGLRFVDAPVLGTREPAEQGTLTVLAAGPEEARTPLEPVLDAVAARTVWVGERPGEATRLKLVCNSWVLTVTHGVAEALALAEGLGVDPQRFLDAVAGGPLDMGYLRAKSEVIRSGRFEPSFAVATAEKDARLIVAAAGAAGVRMDLAAAGAERFRRAARQGHAHEDMAASYFAGFAGAELAEEAEGAGGAGGAADGEQDGGAADRRQRGPEGGQR
ncbi:NAD(P)-dependent oxidoreductase [Streptomyces sp. JJ36]|uniref:NAD(P)-dependent oxidoreductase n=1 Tax=Streptomyces sp. JJ36 TaxID=2736645 RepID=UPI001F33E4B2|nr:NAD(P)-dependent oxidoreductase [Streptomyces sp. JJ36]MCF6524756.1 NAD(P)-dependent oxidoreductase [Streptomyces sp. JJ36]